MLGSGIISSASSFSALITVSYSLMRFRVPRGTIVVDSDSIVNPSKRILFTGSRICTSRTALFLDLNKSVIKSRLDNMVNVNKKSETTP